MPQIVSLVAPTRSLGALEVTPFLHPQGCRGYLVVEPVSRDALLLDPHLDGVLEAETLARSEGLRLRWVVDTHTHADHPSGAAALARELGAARVAHPGAGHAGVTHPAGDGDALALGDEKVQVRHAPGHTPDHLVLLADGALFSGDSLFIGSVARADFLGGDAGRLYDSIHEVMLPLPGDTVLYPGHDYAGRVESTLADERRENPWLRIGDRDRFVAALTANRPAEPANMAALLRFNREAGSIPPAISAEETVRIVNEGGAGTIIDVRRDEEIEAAHVPGSRHIVLDRILLDVDEVRRTPVPRLILCRSGHRAEMARRALAGIGVHGLSVVSGGILAYGRAGGVLAGGRPEAVGEGGGCCAALPPS